MDHQLAEFITEYGSICTYGRGLLIKIRDNEPIFLGGEMIVHFHLFQTFMELRRSGDATRFGGDVYRKGSDGQASLSTGHFSIVSSPKPRYRVEATSFDGIKMVAEVPRSFLNDFTGAMEHWFDSMKDQNLVDLYRCGENWWHISGSLRGTPLFYKINERSFVIEVPERVDGIERFYVFETVLDDYELWTEVLYKARLLLTKHKEHSWYRVLATDDRSMLVELEGGQVFLTIADPGQSNLNICLGANLAMLNSVHKLIKAVWSEEAAMSEMDSVVAELLGEDDD